MNAKKPYLGYLELSLAQSCIGINIILGKILVPGIPVFLLLLLRFSLGFILIFSYQILRDFSLLREELKILSTKDYVIIFSQAMCAGFLFNVLMLYGLERTTATVTGIISSAVPALVAIFSVVILREKLTSRIVTAVLLCVVGIIILGLGKAIPTDSNQNEMLGIILVILSIIPEAFFTILAKLLKRSPPPLITTLLVNFFNMALLIPFTLYFLNGEPIHITPSAIFQIFLYGLTGGVLFFVFWYRGLVQVSASTSALFMGVMPISTCVLAYFFLQERIDLEDWLGMFFVLASIIIGTQHSKSLDKGPPSKLSS